MTASGNYHFWLRPFLRGLNQKKLGCAKGRKNCEFFVANSLNRNFVYQWNPGKSDWGYGEDTRDDDKVAKNFGTNCKWNKDRSWPILQSRPPFNKLKNQQQCDKCKVAWFATY